MLDLAVHVQIHAPALGDGLEVAPVFLTRTVSRARWPPSTVLRMCVVMETPGQVADLAPKARSVTKAARRPKKAVHWLLQPIASSSDGTVCGVWNGWPEAGGGG